MYIGNSPASVGNYQVVDDISSTFNGVLKSFALTASSLAINPAKSGQLLVSINGVLQEPDDTGTEGFKVSGSNIVFSSAPATSSTFWAVFQGQNVDIGTPSDGTVGTAQMSYPLDNFTSTGIDDNATSTKLTVSATGVDVTGSVTCDGFTSTGIDDNATAELLSLNADGNTQFGASVPVDTLRYLDLYNTSTGSSAGALFRMVTSNAAGTGNTTTNIIKYKNSGFLINNNDTASSNFTAFGVAGAERMRIDSAGRVTMPYQPVISINRTGNALTIAEDDDHFATTSVSIKRQQGITHNTANGRFTVPVGGAYYVHFYSMKNSAGTAYFQVRRNGAEIGLRIYDTASSTGWHSYGLGGVYTFAAGDYINLVEKSAMTDGSHGVNHSNFTIYLIG
jgi:hypothetical protein